MLTLRKVIQVSGKKEKYMLKYVCGCGCVCVCVEELIILHFFFFSFFFLPFFFSFMD